MSNRRPQLSSRNLDKFYDIIDELCKSEKQFDLYKVVFLLYVMYPNITPEELHNRINMPTGMCRQVLLDILIIIEKIQSEDTKEFAPLVIIPDLCKEPQPYIYIDQHGKKWTCLNEFFGL